MAWFRTNNPSGNGVNDCGRIMAEILHAINEREEYMGYTETVWTTVGSYPAVNAFAGVKVTLLRTWIEEARGVIDGTGGGNVLLANIAGADQWYVCDAAWNHYDFATLYNDAMGAGATWITADLTGEKITLLAEPLEELMKCLNLLDYFELITGWTLGTNSHYATTDDFPAGSYWILRTFMAGNDTYRTTWVGLFESCWRKEGGVYDYVYISHPVQIKIVNAQNIAPEAQTVIIEFDEIIGGLGHTIYDCTVYARTSDAAEWAGSEWAPTGDLIDSQAITVAEEGVNYEWDIGDACSWNTTYYLRLDLGQAQILPQFPIPFGSRTRYLGNGLGPPAQNIMIRYSQTSWTYG